MAMIHAGRYPCCGRPRGRCAEIGLWEHYSFRAYLRLQDLVFHLFGFRAAGRLIDAYFALTRSKK